MSMESTNETSAFTESDVFLRELMMENSNVMNQSALLTFQNNPFWYHKGRSNMSRRDSEP